eukprot:GFYU01017753.1.p1 GENE.GFYU01017753.1~~GFYU01017753.1.p1  ORF type:complete len:567 (-),score=184.44 GFYU01017753.1:318-2018(-)
MTLPPALETFKGKLDVDGRPLKVAVVGAGISGVIAAAYLKDNGVDVDVIESRDAIGGQWLTTYPGAHLQNTYNEYEMIQLPHEKKDIETFDAKLMPSATYLIGYITKYAEEKGIMDCMMFNHTVVSMEEIDREDSRKGWRLTIENGKKILKEDYDYVIAAAGFFARGPSYPKAVYEEVEAQKAGKGVFEGEIIHSYNINRDADLDGMLKNKKVSILGFGKTALDFATFTAEMNKSESREYQVAHIFRKARWTVAQKLLGIRWHNILMARHGNYFMDHWYLGWGQWVFQNILFFIPFMFWRLIELVTTVSQGYAPWSPMIPFGDRIEKQLRSSIALTPTGMPKLVKQKHIRPRCGEVASFTKDGLVLNTGEEIKTDVLISATGTSDSYFPAWLPQSFLEKYMRPDGLYLYRHMMHPDLPNVGFVGYNHCFHHTVGCELGMMWLMAVMAGDLVLPSREDQLKSIEKEAKWKEKNHMFEVTRASGVATRAFGYFDQMTHDLGTNARMKCNPMAESLMPYSTRDYEKLPAKIDRAVQKMRARAEKKAKKSVPTNNMNKHLLPNAGASDQI